MTVCRTKTFRFFSLLAILTFGAQAEPTLKYDISGSDGWYPYYANSKHKPGIMRELIPIILAGADITGESLRLPPKRTIIALENGQIDFDLISPSWLESGKLSANFVLSEPIIDIDEYIIFKPEDEDKWKNAESLHGRMVGTVRGYIYHDSQLFNRYDFKSEKEVLKAVEVGRVGVAIVGDLPARYWSNELGIDIKLGPIHSSGQLHIRLRAEHEPLLPKINESINILKQNGTIEKVVQSYLTQLSPTQPSPTKTRATSKH